MAAKIGTYVLSPGRRITDFATLITDWAAKAGRRGVLPRWRRGELPGDAEAWRLRRVPRSAARCRAGMTFPRLPGDARDRRSSRLRPVRGKRHGLRPCFGPVARSDGRSLRRAFGIRASPGPSPLPAARPPSRQSRRDGAERASPLKTILHRATRTRASGKPATVRRGRGTADGPAAGEGAGALLSFCRLREGIPVQKDSVFALSDKPESRQSAAYRAVPCMFMRNICRFLAYFPHICNPIARERRTVRLKAENDSPHIGSRSSSRCRENAFPRRKFRPASRAPDLSGRFSRSRIR